MSSGNTLTYTDLGTTPDSYTIVGTNADTGKTYTYTSSTGHITG